MVPRLAGTGRLGFILPTMKGGTQPLCMAVRVLGMECAAPLGLILPLIYPDLTVWAQ